MPSRSAEGLATEEPRGTLLPTRSPTPWGSRPPGAGLVQGYWSSRRVRPSRTPRPRLRPAALPAPRLLLRGRLLPKRLELRLATQRVEPRIARKRLCGQKHLRVEARAQIDGGLGGLAQPVRRAQSRRCRLLPSPVLRPPASILRPTASAAPARPAAPRSSDRRGRAPCARPASSPAGAPLGR